MSNPNSYGTHFYVLDEHTLCYQQPGMTDLGVLHASVLRGSPQLGNPFPGPLPMPMDTSRLRLATLQDFHDYRVSPKGLIEE